MELTELRLVPPTRRCEYVLRGTTARSLLDVASDELSASRTPTTCSFTPLKVTDCPIGSALPNSCVTVSGPRTITELAWSSSDVLMKRPLLTPRERIVRQAGV